MVLRLIVVLFLFSCSSSVFAQIQEVPDSAAVTGVGKVFEVKNSPFINVTVESSNDVFGYVQSLDQEISINIAKPVPELLSTVLTIKNLAPATSYNLIKNGMLNSIMTDEAGTYQCEVDLSLPQKIQITNHQ